MDEKAYLLKWIKKVQKRMNTGILLRRSLEGLCVGLFIGTGVEVYAYLKPFYYSHVCSIIAVVLSLIVGIVIGCLQDGSMALD